MLEDMAHVSIGVKDLDRALEFYTGVLGMKVSGRKELPSGTVLVLVGTGGACELELTYSPKFCAEAGNVDFGLRHVAFWVDDIDKEVQELKLKGVQFNREPAPRGAALRVAFFKDPDGVDIELMER